MTHPKIDDQIIETGQQPAWCRDHRGKEYTFDHALELLRKFHGYPAPGLVVGVKMVTLALDYLPKETLFDAISETRSCLPDAIQLLTLCTAGNNWLKIKNYGQYALTLYDKYNGKGVRVFLDPEKLKKWPEFHTWFYKLKPKKEQDSDRLFREIHQAGTEVLSLSPVRVKPALLERQSKGTITTCPVCKEAYPASQGPICRICRPDSPYDTRPRRINGTPEPPVRTVPVEQAAGERPLHDMTQIMPGQSKGPAFFQGQQLTGGDLCQLQKMGRMTIHVQDDTVDTRGWIHENQAALAFAEKMAGEGVYFDTPPREGKITFKAKQDGFLVVNRNTLESFNWIQGVMCASRRNYTRVSKEDNLGATRAIPLFLPETDFNAALAILDNGPLFSVRPLEKARIGILVTGTEVFRGLVKDGFIPVITEKAEAYGCEITDAVIVPDELEAIKKSVGDLIGKGAEIIVTTAGLSVDPDDVTRQGLVDAGCTDMLYGAPVLPGAMSLVGKIGEVGVMGVPACGLYHEITCFDLLLPMVLAGIDITRGDLAAMGHGGYCLNCGTCTFPRCGLGR